MLKTLGTTLTGLWILGQLLPGTVAAVAASPCLAQSAPGFTLTEQNLRRGTLSFDASPAVAWGEDSYVCGTARGASAPPATEIALLVGDIDRGRSFNQTLTRLVRNLISAAAASGRLGCVYVLSSTNLRRLAGRPALERVIFLGRGPGGGDLASALSPATLAPERLLPLASGQVRGVHVYGGRVSAKIQAWHHVFNHSPDVSFVLEHEAAPVLRALTLVEDLFDEVRTCRL